MIYPILSSKVPIFSIWIWQTIVCLLEHVWNMFTVNNKDTVTMPLSSFLILNSFIPHSSASVANFEQVVPCWDGWYHKKNLSK